MIKEGVLENQEGIKKIKKKTRVQLSAIDFLSPLEFSTLFLKAEAKTITLSNVDTYNHIINGG